jgi:hypothetical protein
MKMKDHPDDGGAPRPPQVEHLRAAQRRARALRGGLVRIALGTVFLIGALSHALSPERHETSSRLWMTGLLLSSSVNVAFGLRVVFKTIGLRPAASWAYATAAWAVLGLTLLGLLLRR